MKSNNFQVCRSIWTHQLFSCEPFTEREAWMWLVSEAAWDDHRVRVAAVMVSLKRGQVSHSLRWMARTWQWKEPRVRRFLIRLKNDAMIDAAADTGVTVITICNYDQYQLIPGYNDAPETQQSTQHRRSTDAKRNTLNSLNTKKDSCSSGDERLRVFWEAYPRKVGKKAAEKAFKRAIKETTLDVMLKALEIDKGNWREERFTPHPATWLNQGRYLDHQPTAAKPFYRPSMEEIRANQRKSLEESTAKTEGLLDQGTGVCDQTPAGLGNGRG